MSMSQRNGNSLYVILSVQWCPFQCKAVGRSLTTWSIIFLILCGGGLASSQQSPVLHSAGSESISGDGASNFGSISSFNSNVDSEPLVSAEQQQYSPPSRSSSSSSSLSSPSVRAVSTRPSSDISTTSDSESSVPSHYDVCPNADAWCSSLDENEKLALEAIHALHHQLDDDKNGNIDLYESNEFLREELKYDKDYEKRQENFHRNNDNQVSVRELWETWVKSEVHNWTVDQTVEWIGTFVGLPHYQERFSQLEINGTYLPRLAVNHHNFLTTNLGIKDVITRQKLTLKAQDVVLFGPPRDNTNRTKDIILTTLLVVAVTVCYLVYCRYKSSQRDLTRMSKDMEALMKAEETLRDLQKEMEQAKSDQEIREKEAVTHRSSSDDEDELIKLREEVTVLRNELQRAEVELQDKCWVPPPALTHWLQLTYELESKAHSKKRQSAEKQLKQAKEACDKLKKKRSSLMGAFVATHARSIDDVDKAILEARAALTEVTQELQERMHRWKQIEMLVKSPIVNNPGLASLEILLRSRANPYLGTGSVLSNSQDDIDDDGASSIYCPSAVHKLISTSAFMMFPAAQGSRSYQQHAGSSDYSSLTNYGSGESGRPSQSPDVSRRDQQRVNNMPMYQNDCSYNNAADFGESNEVSGPITNIHAPIARSKSVQSMLSLRDQRGFNRESSSKDSSNGEDDMILGDAAEMTAKDRRVTFRAAADRRSGQLRSFQGRATGPLYEPMEFEETRNFYARKSANSRLEGSKSSEEEYQQQQQHRKKQFQEEPDLIPSHQRTNNDVIEEEETLSITEDDSVALPETNIYHHNHHTQNHVTPIQSLSTESDLQSECCAEEPNKVLVRTNNYTYGDNSSTKTSQDESSTPRSKMSFIKKISKLMRFGHDGLSGKKTVKVSITEHQQNNSHDHLYHHQQTRDHHPPEKLVNGNNNSGNHLKSTNVETAAERKNLVVAEKSSILASNHSSCNGNNNISQDYDSDASSKSSKQKASKMSLKFFTSLRNRKQSSTHKNSEMVAP